jgi:hypothetical protein
MKGPHLPRDKLVESLQMLIAPGDRIVLEGDNHRGGACGSQKFSTRRWFTFRKSRDRELRVRREFRV